MTYILRRTKPAGSFIHHSRYTLSRTRGLTKQVASEIRTNAHSFGLIFSTRIIYIHSSRFLHLQSSRACIACLVESIGEITNVPTITDAWDFERQRDRTRTQLSLGMEYMPTWSVSVGSDCYICR